MFNDLSGNKNSSGVDDIFAETDKSVNNAGQQIETRQVGLSSSSNMNQAPASGFSQESQGNSMSEVDEDGVSSGGKFLKVAIFAVLGAILILGGYLVYDNFLKTGAGEDNLAVIPTDNNVEQEVPPVNNQDPIQNQVNNQDDFIVPLVDQEEVNSNNQNNNQGLSNDNMNQGGREEVQDPILVDSDGDGLSDYDEVNIYGTNPNLIDSDFDGLSDYEEVMTYKTNPLKADTDGDGLTDYEEVKVYGTDPLKADTDGDGYSDGEEIKAGYNPLDPSPGARMPGF